MAGENPLVAAPPAESNSFFNAGTGDNGWATGISIAESAMDTFNGIKDGNWIEGGLGLVGLAADAAAMAIDPFGTLLSSAASFLMEHMQPLKEMLDWLAGNPPVIESYSTTWNNVAAELGKVAEEYTSAVQRGTEGWTGSAAETYHANSKVHGDALTGAASAAGTVGTVVGLMGMVVGFVREMVRDLIADLVGKLIAWVLEAVFTLGFGTPVIVAQAVTAISRWAAKIAKIIQDLLNTIKKVSPMLKRLVEVFEKIMKVVGKLAGKVTGLDVLDPKNIKKGGFLQTGRADIDTPSGSTSPGGTSPGSTNSGSTSTSDSSPDGDTPSSRPSDTTTTSSTTTADPTTSRPGRGDPTDLPPTAPRPGRDPNSPDTDAPRGNPAGSPTPGSPTPGSPTPGSPGRNTPTGNSPVDHRGGPGGNTPVGEHRGGPMGQPTTTNAPGPNGGTTGPGGGSPNGGNPGGGGSPGYGSPSGGGTPGSGSPSGGGNPGGGNPGGGNPTGGGTPGGGAPAGPGPSRMDQTAAANAATPEAPARPDQPHSPAPSRDPGSTPQANQPTAPPGASPAGGGAPGGGAPGGGSPGGGGRPGGGGGWTGTPGSPGAPNSPGLPGNRGDFGSGVPNPRGQEGPRPSSFGPSSAGPTHAGPPHAGPPHTGQPSFGPTGNGPAHGGSHSPGHPGPTHTGPGNTGPSHHGPGSTGPSHAGPNAPGGPHHGPSNPGPGNPGPGNAGPRPHGPAGTGPTHTGPANPNAPHPNAPHPNAPHSNPPHSPAGPPQQRGGPAPGTHPNGPAPHTPNRPFDGPPAPRHPDTQTPTPRRDPDSQIPPRRDQDGIPAQRRDPSAWTPPHRDPDPTPNRADTNQPDTDRPAGDRPDNDAPNGDRPHNDPNADSPNNDRPDNDRPDSDRPDIDEAHARHGETTPAGISHHRGDPDMGDLPHRVPPDPRYFTADVHVTPDGRARIGNHTYSPEQYGDLLRRNGWDGKTPIRLIGCDAGSNDFANRLSRHTGADVLAPTKPAWTDSNGRVYTSDAQIGPDGNRQPKIPPNGEWNTHRPDGTTTRTGDDGFAPGTKDTDKTDLVPTDARDRGDDGTDKSDQQDERPPSKAPSATEPVDNPPAFPDPVDPGPAPDTRRPDYEQDKSRGSVLEQIDPTDSKRVTLDENDLIETVDGKPVKEYVEDLSRKRAHEHSQNMEDGDGPVSAVAIDRRTGLVTEGVNGQEDDLIPEANLHPLLRENYRDIADWKHPAMKNEGEAFQRPVLDENGKAVKVLGEDGKPIRNEKNQPLLVMEDTVFEGRVHHDQPLRHAEVKATNELLWERQRAHEEAWRKEHGADSVPPPLSRETLQDLRFDPRWTEESYRKSGTERVRTREIGDEAPACANCNSVLRDVPSYTGRIQYHPYDYRSKIPGNFVPPATD